MPSSFQILDDRFPTFRGDESPAQQIRALQDYLYVMKEQLRFALNNLGSENWNQTSLRRLTDGAKKEPLELVAKLEKKIGAMQLVLDDLYSRVTDTETEISYLQGSSETAAGSISGLQEAVASTEQAQANMQQQLAGLEGIAGNVDALIAAMEAQQAVVSPGEEGDTIGSAGRDLHLWGNIYINGVLYGAAESEEQV